MTRLACTAAAAALAALLAGCGTAETRASNDASPGQEQSVDHDRLFPTFLRDQFPAAFGPLDDDMLVMLGEGVCAMFDEGYTFLDIFERGLDAGYNAREAGGLIGTSTVAFCPEHEEKVG